jgi:hypothetical protein
MWRGNTVVGGEHWMRGGVALEWGGGALEGRSGNIGEGEEHCL